MAEDDSEQQPEESPAEVLKKVEKLAGVNKILMIAVLVVSGIVISVMATGLTVMFLRISALNEAAQTDDEDPVEEQLILLEQQLMLLADFRKSELKKISAYTRQLEKIGQDCSLEKSAPYREFLSGREKDFQKLLNTIKSGSSNLASMSKGSKKWLGLHSAALNDLNDSSIERKNKLDSMISRSK